MFCNSPLPKQRRVEKSLRKGKVAKQLLFYWEHDSACIDPGQPPKPGVFVRRKQHGIFLESILETGFFRLARHLCSP